MPMYRIASHDTMAYLKPRKWWMRLFNFMAQCQSKTIEEQYELGIRMFDLRIKYDKDLNPRFAHGLVEYDKKIEDVLDYLASREETCFVRIILENPKSKLIERYSIKFVEDVNTWVNKYSNLVFFEGRRKCDWKLLIDLGPNPDYVQMISSMTGTILDDWCPKLFAWLHNKDIRECGTSHDWLFMDFIGKY